MSILNCAPVRGSSAAKHRMRRAQWQTRAAGRTWSVVPTLHRGLSSEQQCEREIDDVILEDLKAKSRGIQVVRSRSKIEVEVYL